MTMRYSMRQRGFTIVSAIFLLVVLAGLGAAIASISTMQHTSSALDVQGARAYQAARAGIEWGVYQQLIGSSCPGAATSFTLPASAPTLSAFTVTVTCTLSLPYSRAGLVTTDASPVVAGVGTKFTTELAVGYKLYKTDLGPPVTFPLIGTVALITDDTHLTLAAPAISANVGIAYFSSPVVYQITSTASAGTSGSADYIERQMQVSFE